MFSPAEEKVLKIIGRRKMTIEKISDQFFVKIKTRELPIDPQNYVAGVVRRINVKCEYHRLPWFLNGYGRGRGGRTVWRDKN